MRTRVAILLVAVALPMVGGCATALNTLYFKDYESGDRIYGGVRLDAEGIRSAATQDDHQNRQPSPFDRAYTTVLCAADMPLSAVADTLTLPYTIAHTLNRMGNPEPLHQPPAGKLSDPQGTGRPAGGASRDPIITLEPAVPIGEAASAKQPQR